MHSHYLSQHPPLGHGPNSHTPPMSDREMWLADYIVGRVMYLLEHRQTQRDACTAEIVRDALAKAGLELSSPALEGLSAASKGIASALREKADDAEIRRTAGRNDHQVSAIGRPQSREHLRQ